MQPDNEQIIATLATGQQYLRDKLVALVLFGATPHTLSCVVEAMRSLNFALTNDDAMLNLRAGSSIGHASSELEEKLFARLEGIEKTLSTVQEKLN